MTKFEEELNKIEVEVQTPIDKYIVEKAASDESLYAQHYEAVLEKFKDWHPDEDYQRAKRMVERMQFENELLKNKLKQQALPVVPECVGEIIKKYKGCQSVFGVLKTITLDRKTDVYEWVFSEGNQDTFALAFITGEYSVEKPQLFYLKHIDMSKNDEQFDHYLFRIEKDRLAHHIVIKNKLPHKFESVTFSQKEIDSMQTGSYEQIEVAE